MVRRSSRLARPLVLLALLCCAPAGAFETGDHQHPDDAAGLEGMVPPVDLAAATPFLSAKQHGALLYFLYASPARLERYDLDSQAWLPMILLPSGPTAFDWDASALYVACGSSVYAFLPNGTGQHLLRVQSVAVEELFAADGFVITVDPATVSSISTLDGSLIDQEGVFYSIRGASFDGGAVFGRTVGVSPADILRLAVFPGGTLGTDADSPYHGDFPGASRTFPLPGIGAVADDSGLVYDAADLTYHGSLAGPFADLATDGSSIVVLRAGTLIRTGPDLLRAGIHTPAFLPVRVFARGDAAFAVWVDVGGAVHVERIPFTTFAQPVPPPPPDPDGLDFTPDELLLAPDDIVFLLASSQQAVFRWSSAKGGWIESLATVGHPLDMALSETGERLFLSYPGGEITSFDLTAPQPIEVPFVNSPQTPWDLATAGDILFVSDPSGAWDSHFTYSPAGELVSWVDWNYYSTEYIWSPARQKMYFFRDSQSPNDLYWEDIAVDGTLGAEHETPYHGDYGFLHPIRVDPPGDTVLVGTGHFFDAVSLVHTGALPNPVADAAWLYGGLYTLRANGTASELQRWSPAHEELDTRQLPGTPLRLFALANRLLVVTEYQNRPRFWTRFVDLSGPAVALAKSDGHQRTLPGTPLTYLITVHNIGTQPLAGVLVDDPLPFGLDSPSWTCVGSGGGSCPPGPVPGDLSTPVDLPVGGSVSFTITAQVRVDVLGTLRNRAAAFVGSSEEAAATDVTEVVETLMPFSDGFESGDLSGWPLP